MNRPVRPLASSVGQLLLLAREMKGQSLRAVAAATGVSCPFISQIEQGKTLPGLEAAVALCDHYGLKLERLAAIIRNGKGGAA